jgi:8-oxo-dGTP diphosphatase
MEDSMPKLVTGGPELLPDCSNYDSNAYEKAMNTVDTIIARIVDSKLCVLLVKRKWNPFQGSWAIPGGFLNIKGKEAEILEEAALRELEEETGATGIPVHQLGAFDTSDPRGPLITTVFFALVSEDKMSAQKIKAADDAEDLMWAPVDTLNDIDIGFPHHIRILEDFLTNLKDLVVREPLAFHLVPEHFTWKELQDAYEAVLQRPVQNIRRKVLSRYEVEEIGKKEGVTHRPPAVLKYVREKDLF